MVTCVLLYVANKPYHADGMVFLKLFIKYIK